MRPSRTQSSQIVRLSLAPSLELISSPISLVNISQCHTQLIDDYAREATILDFVAPGLDWIPTACDDN